MIITKIRKPLLTPLSFQPIEDNLWKSTVSISGSYTAPTEYVTLGYDFTDYNITDVEIGNIYVDSVEYTEKASKALAAASQMSWFFDFANQELYISPSPDKRIDSSFVDTLKVTGYSSEDVYYDQNGIEYLPYMDINLSLIEEADRLVYQKMTFVKNTIPFKNHTGEFNQFADNPTPGSDVEVYYLENVQDTPKPVFIGYSDGDTFTKTGYQISVQDKRDQLNLQIPNTVFDSSTYPNIGDNEGITIPEGYGTPYRIPAYCTNLNTSSGDVTYKYATDGTTIGTVYVKIDEVWTEKTPTASSGTSCTFTLSAADGRDAAGNPLQALVQSPTLRSQVNPADIIADILYRHNGDSYNSVNFNTAQWASEKADLADICLYMGEGKPIIDWIEDIQSSSNYGFRFYIDVDDRYNIKLDRNDRAVSQTILPIDNVDMEVQTERDFVEYATSIRINYDYDYVEKEHHSYVIDNTYEADTYQIYRKYVQKTVSSLLCNSTDAAEKAGILAQDYSVARLKIGFKVLGISDLSLYDIITIDTGSYIDGELVNSYLGTRTIKIIKTVKDFSNETTYIQGYDIGA